MSTHTKLNERCSLRFTCFVYAQLQSFKSPCNIIKFPQNGRSSEHPTQLANSASKDKRLHHASSRPLANWPNASPFQLRSADAQLLLPVGPSLRGGGESIELFSPPPPPPLISTINVSFSLPPDRNRKLTRAQVIISYHWRHSGKFRRQIVRRFARVVFV